MTPSPSSAPFTRTVVLRCPHGADFYLNERGRWEYYSKMAECLCDPSEETCPCGEPENHAKEHNVHFNGHLICHVKRGLSS